MKEPLEIKGAILNQTSIELPPLLVDISLFDMDNNKVGMASVSTKKCKPGHSSEFVTYSHTARSNNLKYIIELERISGIDYTEFDRYLKRMKKIKQ